MIYLCYYCGAPIRPRDNVESAGNPDAVSHGPCRRCNLVAMTDPNMPADEVRRRSAAMVPACQRAGGL